MAILIVVLVIAAALGLFWVNIHNGIVTKNNRCDNAWQTIDAQLQRRNDLIPNLVSTVQGYMKHENETLTAVTQARAAVASAGTPEAKMAASGELTQALSHLFAVAEAYPDLKASSNFAQLQADLTDTENKISYARMSYNDCVLEYNNAITTFPGSLVAGSKFTTRQGFVIEDAAARQAPTVQF